MGRAGDRAVLGPVRVTSRAHDAFCNWIDEEWSELTRDLEETSPSSELRVEHCRKPHAANSSAARTSSARRCGVGVERQHGEQTAW